MQRIINEGQTLRAPGRHRRRGARGARPRAVQVRARRPQGRQRRRGRRGRGRRGRRRRADDLRQHPTRRHPRLGRPLPRSAHPEHQAHRQRLQADARGGGLLARVGEEPPAPAHLRHRVAHQGRAQGLPRPPRRGREARPPQLGAELDLFSFPDELGSGLSVFHPKGGVIKREMEDYVRRRHIEEGFAYVGTPHISKEGLFHTSGHLPYYADTMFPPMELEGAKYQLKAMNCPMHNLIYQSRGRSYRELPLRFFEFGSRLPLREVRRRARPDPRARHDAGRLALLRHRRAGAGRDQAPARLRARRCCKRLRPRRLLPRAVDPRRPRARSRQVHRQRRAVGGRDEGPRGRRDRVRSRARARPRRRRLLRPEDLGPGPRRHRPHLADVDDPVRLQPARALRPRVPGRRRHAPAAGDDPLGEVRLDRALPRGARRALRRRVPGVALARCRCSACRSPRTTPTTSRASSTS